MTSRPNLRACLLLGLCAVPSACTNTPIYVGPPGQVETHAVVRVDARADVPEAWRLRSVVTLDGGAPREKLLPEREPTSALAFPVDYTVATGSRGGVLDVRLEALSRDGSVVARARGTVTLAPGRGSALDLVLAPSCTADADCLDALFCNGAEACVDGACAAGEPPCPATAPTCVSVSCNEPNAACDARLEPSACGEGTYCDVGRGCAPGLAGAPRVLDASITPGAAAAGTRVELVVRVSEPLASPPVAYLALAGGVRALLEDVSTDADPSTPAYRLARVLDGTESQGVVPVAVDLLDATMTAASGLGVGSVRLDFLPPSVRSSVAPSPRVASAGARVRVEATFSEETGAPPVFLLRSGNAQVPMVAERVAGDAPAWRAWRDVDGAEAEGTWTAEVSAQDAVGNVRGGVALGEVTLDFTAPGLLATDPPVILPPSAGPGRVVTVTIALTEPVLPGATLQATRGTQAPFAFTPVAGEADVLAFVGTVGNVETGTWNLAVSGLVDVAGNAAPVLNVGELAVDTDAPLITLVERRPSRVPNAQDTLVLVLESTEGLARDPDVRVAGLPMDVSVTGPLQWTATLALAGTALQGNVEARVLAQDVAGNVRESVLATLDVDAVLPSILDVTFTPPVARLGQLARLAVGASEALAGPAELAWTDDAGDPGFQFVSTSPGVQVFELQVDEQRMPGVYALRGVRLVDTAGNAADVALADLPGLALDFTLDNIPPVIVSVTATPTVLSPVEPNHQLAVDVVLGEVLPAEGVAVRAGLEPLACSGSGTTRRCTLAVPPAAVSGLLVVDVEARDAAGNIATASVVVEVDADAPRPVQASVTVTIPPPAGCLRRDLSAVKPGGTVVVRVGTDEPTGEIPVLEARRGTARFELAWQATAGTLHAFGGNVPGDAEEGAWDLFIQATDDVGNMSWSSTGAALLVDGTPAAEPPAEPAAFLYLREPWGSADSAGAVRMQVLPGAPVLEPGARVVFLDSPAATGALRVGEATVAADGRIPDTVLNPADRGTVYRVLVDGACNVAGPPLPLRHADVVLGMGGKVAGQVEPNPHDAWVQPVHSAFTFRSGQLGAGARALGGELGLPADDQHVAAASSDISHVLLSTLHPGEVDFPAVAFDVARDRVVMVGGCAYSSSCVIAPDATLTWEYSRDSGWLPVTPSDPENDGNPSLRAGARAAWAPDRGTVLLFGGFTQSSFGTAGNGTPELWEFNGRSWKKLVATDPEGDGNPPARGFHAMAYDHHRRELVVHGGCAFFDISCAPASTLSDTWAWNGTTWRRLSSGPATPTHPGPLAQTSMAYDAANRTLVMTGGKSDVAVVNTMWRMVDARWVGGAGAPGLPVHVWHSLAYHAGRKRLWLYGGADNFGSLARRILEFDGTRWNLLTGAVSEGSNAGMVHDPVTDEMVILGAYATNNQLRFGTTLRVITPPPGLPRLPTAVVGGTSEYLPTGNRLVRFGGYPAGGGAQLNRTDTWLNGGWTSVAGVAGGPVGRWYHAMLFDPPGNHILMVGGESYPEPCEGTGIFCQAMWSYDGTSWAQVTPASGPPLADPAWVSLAHDPVRARTVISMVAWNSMTWSGVPQTWEWDGATRTLENRTASLPSPPLDVPMSTAWVPAEGIILGFGNAQAWSGALRSYDGTQWTELSESAAPLPQVGFGGLLAHQSLGKAWLVERERWGTPANVPTPAWEWDGTHFVALEMADPEADGHHTAYGSSLTYHAGLGMPLLVSGSQLNNNTESPDERVFGIRHHGNGVPGVAVSFSLDALDLGGLLPRDLSIRVRARGDGGVRVKVLAAHGLSTWADLAATDASAWMDAEVLPPAGAVGADAVVAGRVTVVITPREHPAGQRAAHVDVDLLEARLALRETP